MCVLQAPLTGYCRVTRILLQRVWVRCVFLVCCEEAHEADKMKALDVFGRWRLCIGIALVCLTTCDAAAHRTPVRVVPTFSTGRARHMLTVTGGSQVRTIERAPEQPSIVAHSLDVDKVFAALQTSPHKGLTSEQAEARLSMYGPNAMQASKRKSLLLSVLEQFDDKLVQILLTVAVLSSLLSFFERAEAAWVEPTTIAAILVLNAFVGVWQTRSAEGALEALKRLQPRHAHVVRDGKWIKDFDSAQLVPGDIIMLRVGDRVPADARVVALNSLTFSTDESSLTGESVTVSKTTAPVPADSPIHQKSNMVFAGTVVTNGGCIAVVTETGSRTEMGHIEKGVAEARETPTKTPLQVKLDRFGDQLTNIVGGICLVVWASNYPKFFSPAFSSPWKGALYYAKTAVALGVAAIPEGLPAIITFCLALSTRRLAANNLIVRKLQSVEALGSTSVICTDKTGTLTTNQMTACSLVMFDRSSMPSNLQLTEHFVEGHSYEPVGAVHGMSDELLHAEATKNAALVCTLANDAKLVFQDGKFDGMGEPTEAALRVLVEKLGVPGSPRITNPEAMCRQASDFYGSSYSKLATLPFSRDRKSMSVLARHTATQRNRLFVKGAAEVLLQRCSRVQLRDGTIVPLSPELREQVRAQLQDMAQRPLRCLAFAWSDAKELQSIATADEAARNPHLTDPTRFADVESDLTLVGLCGIRDPARPEVADAIARCKAAGIRVMMITGDSKLTAVSIAREVGIFGKDEDVSDKAFTSREFFDLPEEQQRALLFRGNMVFARAEPIHKQQLVKMLQAGDEVPAMTGDGVNDAPALQQAAIGVAMGVTGTEVSKEAADVILADDNFATIVNAVEEGRSIFTNMQSFIMFLISCNIGEVTTILVSSLMGLPEILTPLHLLWVNLVTDGPPATALAFNPRDRRAMTRPPRSKNEPLLTRWLIIRYLVTGLCVSFATIGILVKWYLDRGVTFRELMSWGACLADGQTSEKCQLFSQPLLSTPQTMTLSVLVVAELVKALSAVSLDQSILVVPPWRNPWLIVSVLFPFLLHQLALRWAPAARVFQLTPLSAQEWKQVAAFAVPIIVVEEILKAVGRAIAARRLHAPPRQVPQGQHATSSDTPPAMF